MADFRKSKYSGSLNLAPECGPVLIELDTDAKTATASLEDPASEYTLQGGGGGGLTYVIPEQTVTITDAPVEINANIPDDLTMFPLKLSYTEILGPVTFICQVDESEGVWIALAKEFAGYVQISKNENGTFLEVFGEDEELKPNTYTISAIRGF